MVNEKGMQQKLIAGAKKKSAKSYVAEIKDDLKKVSWPLQDELKFCTKVVIGATFVLGIGIYIIDLFLKGTLDGVMLISKVMFG